MRRWGEQYRVHTGVEIRGLNCNLGRLSAGEGSEIAIGKVIFFKQKTAYEVLRGLVDSDMCIGDRDKDDQSHRVDACVVDGSEKIEQVAIRVRDILNYAKGKQQILMVYIVDSVAITFALLLLAKCVKYPINISYQVGVLAVG